jgi:hypothetical protein
MYLRQHPEAALVHQLLYVLLPGIVHLDLLAAPVGVGRNASF